MGIREAVRIALANIRANKLRAFFTVLGTVVGVTFLIAVITLLKGMDAYMEEEFAGRIFGHNTVLVRRVPEVNAGPTTEETWREWQRRPMFTQGEAEWLAANIRTPGRLSYSFDQTARVGDGKGREVQGVNVIGASENFFAIRDLDFQAGRPFSRNEAARGVPVVVLGVDVAKELFEGRPVIGQTVRIGGFPYQVIGLLQAQGSLFGMSMDRMAIAPVKSPLDGGVFPQANRVEDISFKVDRAELLPQAESEIIGLMRTIRRLRPNEDNNFSVETAESALGFWQKISSFMIMVLPMLVGVSLIVGAVVIMNIMLVSVTERTREIGIRKSLGARRRDILTQFLIESSTLSGVGAVAGIGLGIALASLVSAVSPLPARVSGGAVGLALTLGIGVGLAAGVYPAWRAARLDPIVALRSE
ncbi:ABC transporter permease [Longimicrobium sp.]|uniref:ABC transporter permease n=1 Tax=Longimicrobium sp. TaxID=2029185 RepID=UPI002E36F443|nr:ABC transporter permease [Longimicrobium sp.]HEX6036731.1 ABC transporter permease [Longimicrobium sp.]